MVKFTDELIAFLKDDRFVIIIISPGDYNMPGVETTQLKTMLWGGHLWSSGYYINTVGQHGTEEVIKRNIEKQGRVTNLRKYIQTK